MRPTARQVTPRCSVVGRWWRAVWSLAVVVASLCGCADDGPGDADIVEAPATPEAQVEALESALESAREEGEWTRAEVILETLSALEGKTAERRVALSDVRRNREIATSLGEVEALLDEGAWRSALAYLESLEAVDLSAPDQVRANALRALAREVERAEANRALLPPTP